jgi:hypothetical protein
MYAPPRTVRLVSAALAAFIGATLLLAAASLRCRRQR